MRAVRHPAEDIFRRDDAEQKTFRRAVERGHNQKPVRLQQRRQRRDERVEIGDMLDDFERGDEVELPASSPRSGSMACVCGPMIYAR